MPLAQLLFSVLATGAELVASGVASEFARGAGKTAFEAIRERLTAQHGIRSLPLLAGAAKDPAFAAAIKAELATSAIADDGELLRLAQTLREAIAALPSEPQARYAVNIDEIRSGSALLFETVEGVTSKSVTSAGDMTFKQVHAPPGKP